MSDESMVEESRDAQGNLNVMVRKSGGQLMTADAYIDEQMQLLKLFGLKGIHSFENYEVVVRGEQKVLVKREHPLKCDPSDDNTRVISQLVKTQSERFFGREGKEEDRLELVNPSHNLEVGEVESFSREF